MHKYAQNTGSTDNFDTGLYSCYEESRTMHTLIIHHHPPSRFSKRLWEQAEIVPKHSDFYSRQLKFGKTTSNDHQWSSMIISDHHWSSSFIIHHSSFIIHHSSFIIHHSSIINHHSSFIIHHSSFIIHHSSFIIHHSSSSPSYSYSSWIIIITTLGFFFPTFRLPWGLQLSCGSGLRQKGLPKPLRWPWSGDERWAATMGYQKW